MIKFQLVSSLLFLSGSCATVAQINWVGTQNKLLGSSVKIIARKIGWKKSTFHLKSTYRYKYMDDPVVAKAIRETLVHYEELSPAEAALVQPEHLLLTGIEHCRLKVFDGASTAWSQITTWHIEEQSEIIPWTADNYQFHFLAYFTPGNYLWLKNILMHHYKFSRDDWFLGCFMQVLNDNHFRSSENNIPWTEESLTKIFRWDNRLENYMGHFGSWKMDKSETCSAMINRAGTFTDVGPCEDIKILMHNLRDFFHHQTTKNNFGMMLNLEWDYDSDDGYNLRLADIW